MHNEHGDRMLDVATVALRLDVTRQRVSQLLGQNAFPNAQKIGVRPSDGKAIMWLIPQRDVDAYEASRTAAAESGAE